MKEAYEWKHCGVAGFDYYSELASAATPTCLSFPGEAEIFRDMYTQVGEEEQIISTPCIRIQEDVRRKERKKRKQGNALMG